MEKIIIYNVADARKIITMAANMRIKSIVIDNTKLSAVGTCLVRTHI